MVLSQRYFLLRREDGTECRLHVTGHRAHIRGFRQMLRARLHIFRKKRVNGPALGHGLVAELICDFSKATGHSSPITADFLNLVPESSLCKSDFPQKNTQTRGGFGREGGAFHTMSDKIPEFLPKREEGRKKKKKPANIPQMLLQLTGRCLYMESSKPRGQGNFFW